MAGINLFDFSISFFLSFSNCDKTHNSQLLGHWLVDPSTSRMEARREKLTTIFTRANAPGCCPGPALQFSARYGLAITTVSFTTILVPAHLVGSVLLIASKISCASLLADGFLRAAASLRRATAASARDKSAAV